MAKTPSPAPPADHPAAAPATPAREPRLAAALRANLRRRKTPPKPSHEGA